MIRILRLAILLLIAGTASGEYHPPIKYGVATTIDFVLFNPDGSLDVDEADSGTEVTVHCNGSAGTTATNDFVDEGSYYSLALTTAETQCARITLDIAATDRNVVIIPTFGHASAQVESIWAELCEDQGPGYSCAEAMSLLLAEAMGECVYTTGTRTWVCQDPSGTETRSTIVYGSDLDGDRTSSTPAPFTP